MLIVDQNPADRELYTVVLRGMGLKTVAAADGWEGLVCARTLLPEVVVTDLPMPRLDGWELMAQLHANPRTARIPVVLVTGNSRDLPSERVRTARVTAMLTKPLDLSEFQAAIVAALGSTREPAREPGHR